MPFDAAITNTEKNYLRSAAHEARVYLSACPNTTIYTCRINNTDFLYPLAQFPVDGGSGTVADIQIGHTVLISHTNDLAAAFWRGRIRTTPILSGSPASGQLYINETGDLGFADNDYVFILDDFAVAEKLPRNSAGYPIPDWNQSFRKLLPAISNLRSAYADWVDAGTGDCEIDFAPDVLATTSGATISSYTWDVVDGTITVGSGTTKDITATFPPGFRWITFTSTDSGGRTATRRIPVWAHDADNPPTVLAFSDVQIEQEIPINILEGAASGYNATVSAFDGVDSLLDNTLVCLWTDQYYNDVAVDIGSSGNILTVGRLRSEANSTGYVGGQRNSSAQFEIEGPLTQLARLRFPSVRLIDEASPAQFFEITNLTIWRAIYVVLSECSTFLELHSLVFDDTSDDYRMPELNTQGGDLLNTVADLAQSINAVLQDNAAGMCEIARRVSMLSSRGSVTTVLDLTTSDFGDADALNLSLSHIKTVGLVRGDGGGYNTTDATLSAYRVRAPFGAPLGASGDGQIPRQVLVADQTVANEKVELAARAGNALAAMWGPTKTSLHLPDGYHSLTPDAQARYTLTLPASETTRGRAYTTSTYWWLQAKRLAINPQTGRIETHLDFITETSGAAGRVEDTYRLDVGDYPAGLGSSYNIIPIPPTTSGSTITDTGAWTPDLNSHCVSGQNYVDAQYDIGEVKTIKSITISYTATATLTGNLNKVLLRLPGTFFEVYAVWNTQSGSNTVTIDVGNTPAQYIELIAYGDDNACSDTITITGVSYTSVGGGTWTAEYTIGGGLDTWTVNEQPYDGLLHGVYDANGWNTEFAAGPDYLVNIKSPAIPANVYLSEIEVDVEVAIGGANSILQVSQSPEWEINGPDWQDLSAGVLETRTGTFTAVNTRYCNVFLRQQQAAPTGKIKRVKLTGSYV